MEGAPDWVMGAAEQENVSSLGRRPAAAPSLRVGGRGPPRVVHAHAQTRARPAAGTSGRQSSSQNPTPPPEPVWLCVCREADTTKNEMMSDRLAPLGTSGGIRNQRPNAAANARGTPALSRHGGAGLKVASALAQNPSGPGQY